MSVVRIYYYLVLLQNIFDLTNLFYLSCFSRVLDFKRNNFDENTISRSDLLTRKDIHNIKTSFQISIQEGVRHHSDATSVDLWIKECEGTQQVLFYKKQGDESPQLKKEDFCLIYMNNSQKFMFKKFGSNIISIDSTHGLNMYDFELSTILVIDEFGEGYPAACMFTNRKDTKVFELFFEICRENVGVIKPNVFMTDITTVFYSAWEKVMGSVPSHLYCSWHIDRAWQNNLTKVTNCDKRKVVYQTIKVLQENLDENEFLKHLHETINLLYQDSETRNFAKYFCDNYKHNYRQWAYCFRKNCGINTNMHCESMHKSIKYFYLDGKVTKRLDKGLNALLKFIRDKTVERIIKTTKGKHTSHVQNIHAHHRAALVSKFRVEKSGSNNYCVINSSPSKQNIVYVVSKNLDTNNASPFCCHLTCSFCKICIHTFSCTCNDFSIKSVICKHIHFVIINDHLSGLIISNVVHNEVVENDSIFSNPEIKEHLSTLQINTSNTKNLKNIKLQIVHEANKVINNIYSVNNEAVLLQSLKLLKNLNSLNSIKETESSSTNSLNIDDKLKRMPANKNITKQMTFFSTKKKSLKRKENKKPSKVDVINIKNMLNNNNVEFISQSPSTDHTYT